MNPLCKICKKEIEKGEESENWLLAELYMLCENCKRDIKSGKYGNDIIELLEQYSVEKQKTELKEVSEIEYKDTLFFSKEESKQMALNRIDVWYGRRNAPFQEVSNLKTKNTKNLNLHLLRGSNESIKNHYFNNIERYRFYQKALKIHNDIYNDLTQKDIEKYLKMLNDADFKKLKKQKEEKRERKRVLSQKKMKSNQITEELKLHENNLEMINKGICPCCYATIDWDKLDKPKLIAEHNKTIDLLNKKLVELSK